MGGRGCTRCGSTSSPSFPSSSRVSARWPCSAGPECRGARPPDPRPARGHHRRPCAPSTTPPSAAGPAWSSPPGPLFASVERADPPLAALSPRSPGTRFDQPMAEEAGRPGHLTVGRLLRSVRPLRRRRRAGRGPSGGRRAVHRRLRPGRGGGGRRRRHRGRVPAPARDHGQRGLGHRRELHVRSPRVSPLHPARVSGAGRSPRSCAPAITPGSSGGAGPWRCAGHIDERPDLIAARGGISDEERRLLDAEGLAPPPWTRAGPATTDGSTPAPPAARPRGPDRAPAGTRRSSCGSSRPPVGRRSGWLTASGRRLSRSNSTRRRTAPP